MSYPGGGHSPSNPDGGDPPPPGDPFEDIAKGMPKIGAPIHIVSHGNPSGAPCVPGVYLGYDGTDAWVATIYGPSPRRAEYSPPGQTAAGLDNGAPAFAYGTFHVAPKCDVTGPVEPAAWVQVSDGEDFTTDEFRRTR